MNIENLTPAIGSIVYDLDVSKPLSDEEVAKNKKHLVGTASNNTALSKIITKDFSKFCKPAWHTRYLPFLKRP